MSNTLSTRIYAGDLTGKTTLAVALVKGLLTTAMPVMYVAANQRMAIEVMRKHGLPAHAVTWWGHQFMSIPPHRVFVLDDVSMFDTAVADPLETCEYRQELLNGPCQVVAFY